MQDGPLCSLEAGTTLSREPVADPPSSDIDFRFKVALNEPSLFPEPMELVQFLQITSFLVQQTVQSCEPYVT